MGQSAPQQAAPAAQPNNGPASLDDFDDVPF